MPSGLKAEVAGEFTEGLKRLSLAETFSDAS
jgi:hypothetical protein